MNRYNDWDEDNEERFAHDASPGGTDAFDADAPEDEPRQRVPLSQALTFGAGTFLTAGAVDLLAHLGPTGLVVGGIAAYVAARHGPDLYAQVREALPSSPVSLSGSALSAQGSVRRAAGRSPGRSILDRALGRVPADDRGANPDDGWDEQMVEESEVKDSAPPGRSRTPITHPLVLSPTLVLEANDVLDAGVTIFGVKGSGKTVATMRLAEQFARWCVSEVVFDIKGDALSLVTDRRPDGTPFVPRGFVGVRGQAPPWALGAGQWLASGL